MKKLIALLLALLLAAVNVAALAGEPEGEAAPTSGLGDSVTNLEQGAGDTGTTTTAGPSITKTYTTSGTATNVYPTETLEFTVTPGAATYPVVTVGTNNTFDVDGTKATYTIPVTVPDASEYGSAGKYHYEVVETTSQTAPSQGVEYDIATIFNVDVYVYYAPTTDGDDAATTALTKEVVIYSGEETSENATKAAKTDSFKNDYSVGALTVSKEITGNLSDPNKAFSITVTLTAENQVNSDITIDDSNATSVTGETAKGWKEKTITFTATGGQSITIGNIPTGVKYTVEETDIDRIVTDNTDSQMAAVNNPKAYFVSGEVTDEEIGAAKAEVTITNTKDITIPPGVALDTLPYVLIMAVAAIGAVTLVIRKRREY